MNFKKPTRSFRNREGFSLIEVMVAASVSMIVLGAITAMIVNSAKEEKKLSMALDLNNVQTLLQATLNSDASCGPVLQGQQFTPGATATLSSITFAGLTFSRGTMYQGWLVDSIQLIPGGKLMDLLDKNGNATQSLYLGTLIINVHRANSTLGVGPKSLTGNLKVVTQYPTPATVNGCFGATDLSNMACAALGGSYTPAPAGTAPGTPGSCVPSLQDLKQKAKAELCNGLGGQLAPGATANDCLFSPGGGPQYSLTDYIQYLIARAPVNGGWSDWGACSVTACGQTGTQRRSCTNPSPSNGGSNCSGSATQPCSTPACATPVNCIGSWNACSASCGGGTQTYFVTTFAANGGTDCPYSNGATQGCNAQPCKWNCLCADGTNQTFASDVSGTYCASYNISCDAYGCTTGNYYWTCTRAH